MDPLPSPYRGSTRRKREHRQPAFQTYLASKPHSYFRFYSQFCSHSCSHFMHDILDPTAMLAAGKQWHVRLSVCLSLFSQHRNTFGPFQPNTFQGVGLSTGPPTPRCTTRDHLSPRPDPGGWGPCLFRQAGHIHCTCHHNQVPPFHLPTGGNPNLLCFWDLPPGLSDSIFQLKVPPELFNLARCVHGYDSVEGVGWVGWGWGGTFCALNLWCVAGIHV